MGKKLRMLAMFFILLFLPVAASAIEIHLKDGRFIEVERCLEKEGEIIFTLKGGDGKLFSVSRELVSHIDGMKDAPQQEQAAR